MSMSGDDAYVLAMDYVDETLKGGGALKGDDGKSAYQSWLDLGNTGTEEDFIDSLKGADGQPGANGEKGDSGEKGDDGKSAYQYAKDGGYTGTETEFTTNIARSGVISKELEVERARIDNLTTLQDGSTTGDAELIDARIDKDGNTYVNVGEHIRTVSSQLSSEIDEIRNENGTRLFKKDNFVEVTENYYVSYNGTINASPGYIYSSPIKVRNGEIVKFNACGYSTNIAMISTCDENGDNLILQSRSIDKEIRDYEYICCGDGYIVVSCDGSKDYTLTILQNNSDVKKIIGFEGYNQHTMEIVKDEYVTYVGGYATSYGFAHSSPIKVAPGDIVTLKGKGYLDAVAMISHCDEFGNSPKPLVISYDSNVNEYQYNVIDETYIMFSFDYTHPYSATIETDLKEGLTLLTTKINKIPNNENVLSLFRTIGVVGDSYASGEIYYNGTHRDEYTLSWGQILARRNGIICHNYSCGGLTTRSWLTTSYGLPSLLSNEPDDIYFLALGINDYYHEGIDYLGSLSDIKSDYTQNADTFYGNYGKIICKIKEHAPNSKIIIFTVANQNEVPAMFTEAIKKIANHFNIGCIIQSDDEYFTSDFYWNQMIGGHPTALSYSRMSLAFERLINNCIINNIDYFADTLMF